MSRLSTLEDLQERIDRAPFNRFIGLTVTEITDAGITLRIPVREEVLGHATMGMLHGGVMAALIDTAGCYAVCAHTGKAVATVDMRIDYHLPATGPDLIARSEFLHRGKSLSTSEVRVHDNGGRLVASGRVVCIIIKTP